MALAMADSTTDVFVYNTGREDVPQDVVRVRIDPSVLAIPFEAFYQLRQLQEVELHDGLREIGIEAFSNCTALKELQLPDGIARIGNGAFSCCRRFTKFRCPTLVTTITNHMLDNCPRLFSLELIVNIIQVEDWAFYSCKSLRNIALAPNTVVDQNASFHFCFDLLHIFGTQEAIVDALRNRFNGLPFHSKMYYISYNDQTNPEEIFNSIIIGKNGKLDPSGLQQDCWGMTPLHILACSTVQCLELYQFIVEIYPANLIVEDAWGATPLLYAVWGDAPNEIVDFLVNSYQSLYPNHEFDWNDMVITLGRANASKAVLRNLLRHLQPTLSPEYSIDWDQVFGVLAAEGNERPVASPETFCFLTRCSIATRVSAIGVKNFRDSMSDVWMGDDEDTFNRQQWLDETLAKLEYYKSEYRRLQEISSLLELALWKARIFSLDHKKAIGEGNKKMKTNQSDFRLQCRISCGADHVIENVLPYLLPPDFVRSYVYEDNNSFGDEDHEGYDDSEEDDDNDDEEDNDSFGDEYDEDDT